MNRFKEIINKHIKFSLSTMLVSMLILAGVTSCESCTDSNSTQTGSLQISAEKENLAGNSPEDLKGKITLKQVEAGSTNSAGCKLKVKVAGDGGITYTAYKTDEADETGEATSTLVDIEATEKIEELNHFFSMGAEEAINFGDHGHNMEFVFKPTNPNSGQIVVTFELLDNEGNVIGSPVTITWDAIPARNEDTFEMNVKQLNNSEIKITVTNQAGGLQDEEFKNLSVKVSTSGGDAVIDGIQENKIVFEQGDTSNGKIIKKLTVKASNDGETEFEFQLQKGTELVGAPKTINYIYTAPVAGELEIKLDNDNIENGEKKVKVTISKNDVSEIDVDKDLKGKKLKVTVNKNSTSLSGELDLEKATKENDKTYSLDLIIDPKDEKEASFEIELEKDGAEVAGTKKTLNWKDGINLTFDVKHNHTNGEISVELSNQGEATEVKGIIVSFETTDADVKIDGKQKHDLDATDLTGKDKANIEFGTIDFNGKATAEFKFTVKVGNKELSTKSVIFSAAEPEITITVAELKYAGEDKKAITFVLTAIKDVAAELLNVLTFDYEAVGNGKGILMTEKDGGDKAKGKTLNQLGITDELKESATANLILYIDNEGDKEVKFHNIKLVGSHDAESKQIKDVIEWKELPALTNVKKHVADAEENALKATGQLKFKKGFNIDAPKVHKEAAQKAIQEANAEKFDGNAEDKKVADKLIAEADEKVKAAEKLYNELEKALAKHNNLDQKISTYAKEKAIGMTEWEKVIQEIEEAYTEYEAAITSLEAGETRNSWENSLTEAKKTPNEYRKEFKEANKIQEKQERLEADVKAELDKVGTKLKTNLIEIKFDEIETSIKAVVDIITKAEQVTTDVTQVKASLKDAQDAIIAKRKEAVAALKQIAHEESNKIKILQDSMKLEKDGEKIGKHVNEIKGHILKRSDSIIELEKHLAAFNENGIKNPGIKKEDIDELKEAAKEEDVAVDIIEKLAELETDIRNIKQDLKDSLEVTDLSTDKAKINQSKIYMDAIIAKYVGKTKESLYTHDIKEASVKKIIIGERKAISQLVKDICNDYNTKIQPAIKGWNKDNAGDTLSFRNDFKREITK